jgi:hypothetical protein
MAVLFFSRLFLLSIGAYTINSTYFTTAVMGLVLIALFFILFEPYKGRVRHCTDLNVIFILLLALYYASTAGISEATKHPALLQLYLVVSLLSGNFPLFYISLVTFKWIYTNRRFGLNVINRLKSWSRGYDRLQLGVVYRS